jgi:hypothetical protein
MSRMEEIEIKTTVECEGNYLPAKPDHYEDGQWYPGDPADVTNFKVFMSLNGKRIEITDYLPIDHLQELEGEFLQICEGDE